MSLEIALIEMKNKLEEDFKDFQNIVERNKKTAHGKVINKLLTCDPEVLYVFEGNYYQTCMQSMSYLFCVLNHAFADDGEIYIKKIKSPLSCEQFGDWFNYKIVIGENPEGVGLTYKEFDKILKLKIENSIFEKENEESLNKNFDNFNKKDEEIFNTSAKNNRKLEELMKNIYEKNKYKKHK